MIWSAPYFVAMVSSWAAVEFVFIVMMVVTGRRHRVLLRRHGPTRSAVASSVLTPEEVGLLAGGEQRLAEVALLRLGLEGRVELYHDQLVKGPAAGRECPVDNDSLAVRQAMLNTLHNGEPTMLSAVLCAGKHAAHTGTTRRRLVELRLWDEAAVLNARARERGKGTRLLLTPFLVVAFPAGFAIMGSPDETVPRIWLLTILFAYVVWLFLIIAICSMAALCPATPAGVELLAQVKRESNTVALTAEQAALVAAPRFFERGSPELGLGRPVVVRNLLAPDIREDQLLRYVALHGLTALAAFERCAQYELTASHIAV